MVTRLLPLALSLQLAAVWAEDKYLGLAGRGLLVGRASGCSTTGQLSCHNTTVQRDLCCFNAPGGLIMQTQLWDTNPATGPSDSWTVHGLWPDNRDGTFGQFCDPSREENDITGLLTNQGQTSLLSFMQTFWKDSGGNDNSFWSHEWNKHGTCMSTLGPDCVADAQQAAIDYFTSTVNLYKKLPTYTWLTNGGITPSSTKTYTSADIMNALKVSSAYGFKVGLECNSGTLFQVNYYYNVRGSIIDGSFVSIDATTPGSCPSSGIKYLPKSSSGGGTPTTVSGGGGSTPTGVPSSGTISVLVAGAKTGGILSFGTWSTQTPGKMTTTASGSGFTLTSSKGKCGITSGAFTCGSGVTASVFTLTTSGSNRLLTYQGSTAFTADTKPSGTTRVTINTGSARAVDVTLAYS